MMTGTERANVRQACEDDEGKGGEKRSGEEVRCDRQVARIEYSEKKGLLVAQEWLRA